MPPFQVTRNESRVKSLEADFKSVLRDTDLKFHHVYSNHLILASAGYVENSIKTILEEYAQRRGNSQLQRFVGRNVSTKNSLNCEKIKKLVDQFDVSWWTRIHSSTTEEERVAIDSLKTLRDSIAHDTGRVGTSITNVSDYLASAIRFVNKFSNVVLGP